jgi:hypothetical protein
MPCQRDDARQHNYGHRNCQREPPLLCTSDYCTSSRRFGRRRGCFAGCWSVFLVPRWRHSRCCLLCQRACEVCSPREWVLGILGERHFEHKVERCEFGTSVREGRRWRVEVATDDDGSIGVR